MNKKVVLTENQLSLIKEYINNSLIKNTLPKNIKNDVLNQKTSLGNHPSFPPEDEKKFEYKLLLKRYEQVLSNLNKLYPDQQNTDISFSKTELSWNSPKLPRCFGFNKIFCKSSNVSVAFKTDLFVSSNLVIFSVISCTNF